MRSEGGEVRMRSEFGRVRMRSEGGGVQKETHFLYCCLSQLKCGFDCCSTLGINPNMCLQRVVSMTEITNSTLQTCLLSFSSTNSPAIMERWAGKQLLFSDSHRVNDVL